MKKLTWAFVYLAAVYLLIAAGMYVFQRTLLFPAMPFKAVPEAPAPYGNFDVTTPDNFKIRGWYEPAKGRNPTIVYFHGNGDNLPKTEHYHDLLTKQGFGLLLTSYRGYSGNPGHPTEDGLYKDAQSFIDALLKQGLKEEDLIIYGFSLGTGVATEMALRYPKAKALVLGAPYTSISDAASPKYPWLPVSYLIRDKFDSFSKIGKIDMPILIINGKDDEVFSQELGHRLANAAKPDKVTFMQKDGTHVGFFFDHGGDQAIAEWLKQFLAN